MNGLPFGDALHLLRSSQTPVIIIPQQPSSDALGAGLAILLLCDQLGKNAQLVSPDFRLPPGHNFLPKSDAIRQGLSNLRSFIISVNTKNTKLDSLSYNLEGDRLNIYLSPRQGFYEPKDVTTSTGAFAYDLIILLDVPALDQLGKLYEQNVEFFYQTPILNIDHHSHNTRHGQVNLVDVVASSVSEIVFELIQKDDPTKLDEHMATSLLTGIISKTKGFQTHTVTPRSLAVASHLISAGARRDVIVRNLYQTKSISTLRLWGRALTKIESTADGKIVWTTITREDIKQSAASTDDAIGALDELMVNTPTAEVLAMFVEQNGEIAVHIMTTRQQAILGLPEEISPQTPTYFYGLMPGALKIVSQKIISTLQAPPTR